MRHLLTFSLLLFWIHVAISQTSILNITTSSFKGHVCSIPNSQAGQVLINEVMIRPTNGDGSLYLQGQGQGSTSQKGEWIELYNADVYNSIDISCWFLANSSQDGNQNQIYGGGYEIPAGTVIPPLGFCIIRGLYAPAVPAGLLVQNGGKTIERVISSSSAACNGGGYRFWLPNSGGWLGLYNNQGAVVDAISWASNGAGNVSPCNPPGGCPFSGTLSNYNNIPANLKVVLSTSQPQTARTFRRIPDGNSWVINSQDLPTYGTCNSSCAVEALPCNAKAGVSVSGGTPPYTYLWNDGLAQANDTAFGLCAGVYCVTVTDNALNTATACVTVTDNSPTAESKVLCGAGSTTLTASNGMGYRWYSASIGGSFLTNGPSYTTPLLTQTDTFWVCSYDTCESFRVPAVVEIAPRSLAGYVKYDNSELSPMVCVSVKLKDNSGNVVATTNTDLNGYYQFCDIPAGAYHLTATTDKDWGGVNTADAQLAQKHFSLQAILTGLRFKAADATNSNFVNSADALLIQKRFVGLSNSFPAGDWAFEQPVANVNGTTTQFVDFKAICIGDANGSYIPPGCGFLNCGDTLIDKRDGQKYPTVQIGSQCWMQKNLNIGTMINGGTNMANNGIVEKYCYGNNQANCVEYGGLYQWDEMMTWVTTEGTQGICPNGWHLPSNADWCALTAALDPAVSCGGGWSSFDSEIAGGKMKESGTTHWAAPNTGATNSSGFSGLAAGYRDASGLYDNQNIITFFWSSTEASAEIGNSRYLYHYGAIFYGSITGEKEMGYSVRCIKD